MNDRAVIHDVFALKRMYAVPAATGFAAFARAEAKNHWGVMDGVEPQDGSAPSGRGAAAFDFRVGGREFFRMR